MARGKRGRRRSIITAIILLAFAAPILLVASIYRQEKRNFALIVAIRRSDDAAALAAIYGGANPNVIDAGSRSITLSSVWQQMLDRSYGRHPAVGPSALDLAVEAGLTPVACALLDDGATGANDRIKVPFDNVDELRSLLQAAVIQRDSDLAAHLILHGAEVNERDRFDQTPLCVAAANEDLAMVTLLLAHHADPSACSETCDPPLIGALDHSSVNPILVKRLLDYGANANGDGTRYLPLMHAESAEIVSALIAHGADVRVHDHDGESPIIRATYCDNPGVMRLLLDHGANVDDHNSSGETPLLVAAAHGRSDCAALLLARGANVNLSMAGGRTPLMRATEAGSATTVQLLLAHGATAAAIDHDGRSALFDAASAGETDVIKALLRAGARLNARDNVEETALDEAEDTENSGASAALLAAGARSGTSIGRIPTIGRILGLRLGYATVDDIDRRLRVWSTGPDAHPERCAWWIDGADIEVQEFRNADMGNTFYAVDVSGWHGMLRSNTAFQRLGCGPWTDLRVGMTMSEARSTLRSQLPSPTVKPSTLSWIANARGRRAGKDVLFTYTAVLEFIDGLQSLHLDVDATPQ